MLIHYKVHLLLSQLGPLLALLPHRDAYGLDGGHEEVKEGTTSLHLCPRQKQTMSLQCSLLLRWRVCFGDEARLACSGTGVLTRGSTDEGERGAFIRTSSIFPLFFLEGQPCPSGSSTIISLGRGTSHLRTRAALNERWSREGEEGEGGP